MAHQKDVRTGFIHGPEVLAGHKSRVTQAGFTMIPNAVMLRGDLRPGTKIVYGYLKHLAWREKAEAVSTLQEVIAADLHMSVDTVRSMLRELENAPLYEGGDAADGTLVESVRRGQGHPNVYLVNDPAVPPGIPNTRPGKLRLQDAEISGFPIESSSSREDLTPKTSKQDGPRTVAGAPVTDAEVDDARNLLARFNEHAGTGYQASKWVVLIIRRLRERADLSYGDHEAVLDWALAHPWWRDRPSPSVVYGSEEQYERTVEQARAPAGAGGTLTMDEIRAGVGR